MRTDLRISGAVIAVIYAGMAFAVLPPPTDEAKAKAAETRAKSAWSDKVDLYKLCLSQNQTADAYRKNLKADGSAVPPPTATSTCSEPGPYVSQVTPSSSKPLEASGAHSPPGPAISPPSTVTPAAEQSNGAKR
jgi:hypothetical protein